MGYAARRNPQKPQRPVPVPDAAIVCVVVGPQRRPVRRVDPQTQQCVDEAQQFRLGADGRLTILPRSAWVAAPREVWVSQMTYR